MDDIDVFDDEWDAILDYSDSTDFAKGFYTFPEEFKDLDVELAKDESPFHALVTDRKPHRSVLNRRIPVPKKPSLRCRF